MLSMGVPAEEFVGSTDQTVVIKGKRTKRHRSAVTCSSSSGGDHYCGSTSTSGGEVSEEEEDMANCLILLAQGGVTNTTPPKDKCEIMAAATTAKVDFYVYECKACNRTFSSFQALGGHRASHKKPKTAPAEEKRSPVTATHIPIAVPIAQSSTVTVDRGQFEVTRNCHSPPQSLQFSNHHTTTAVNSKPNKLHECSICGSEFNSGQALGGHMRRHRAATVAPATTTTTTPQLTTAAITGVINSSAMDHHQEKRSMNILELDLNLPAPEDDLRESSSITQSKFQFSSAKQSLVFSAPALVDCHY